MNYLNFPIAPRNVIFKDFQNSFESLLKIYGLSQNKAENISDVLLSSMFNKDLHYHIPTHVLSIFAKANELRIELEKSLQLAIWFHDAIYVPGSSTNEEKSASLMKLLLDEFIPEEELKEAEKLILDTKFHLENNENLCKMILDLDVWTLGADPELYSTIQGLLRQEFNIPDDAFNAGRKAFLTAVLDKGFIFRTTEFAHMESQAQENIRKDLERLL